MNPWHDLDLGDDLPDVLRVIVEVPKDSKIKYELDKTTGMIKVDRVLFSSVHYPANYGFIPKTYCDDDDPLDILVLGQLSVVPLSILKARPIGLLKMRDQNQMDDKVIAVHVNDPEYAHYRSIHDLPPHRLAELKRFFEDYTKLENKVVLVESFLDFKDAQKTILEAFELYKQKILPGLDRMKRKSDKP